MFQLYFKGKVLSHLQGDIYMMLVSTVIVYHFTCLLCLVNLTAVYLGTEGIIYVTSLHAPVSSSTLV